MNLLNIIESVRKNLDEHYNKILDLYLTKSQKSFLLVKIDPDITYSYITINNLVSISDETKMDLIKNFKMDNKVHCVFVLNDGSFYISIDSSNTIDTRIIQDIELLRTNLELNSCSGIDITENLTEGISFVIKRTYKRTKFIDSFKKIKIPNKFKNYFFFETKYDNRCIKAIIKRDISFTEWIDMKLDSFSEALLKDRQIMHKSTEMIKENPEKYILVTISSFDNKSCTEYFCMSKKELLSYLNIDGIDIELHDSKYAIIISHRIRELSDIAAKIKYVEFINPIINSIDHNKCNAISVYDICDLCDIKMDILKDRSDMPKYSQCLCCDKIEIVNQVMYCSRCLIYYLLK